ncbi:hypothetical protein D3C80_1065350 [compost metagenome]
MLRGQFTELRAADGLGNPGPKLHVFREIPRHGRGRQGVSLLDRAGQEAGRAAEEVARGHALASVLITDASREVHGRDQLGLKLGIGRMDPQVRLVGGGAVAARDLLDLEVGADVVVREQVVDPRLDLVGRQAVRRNKAQVALLRGAGVVRGRRADAEHRFTTAREVQAIAQVQAAAQQIVVEFAEGDPVRLDIVDKGAVRQLAVAEARLIGGVARRLGVGEAPFRLPGLAEEVLAGQLGREQLANRPFRIVVAHHIAAEIVEAGACARLLGRVAGVEVGPAHLMVARLEADAAEQVQADVVLGGLELIVGADLQLPLVDIAFLADAFAALPLVVIARHEDEAERAEAQLLGQAARGLEAEVDRGLFLLQQAQGRVLQRLADAAQVVVREVRPGDDAASRPEGEAQRPRHIARAVVKAREVRA